MFISIIGIQHRGKNIISIMVKVSSVTKAPVAENQIVEIWHFPTDYHTPAQLTNWSQKSPYFILVANKLALFKYLITNLRAN